MSTRLKAILLPIACAAIALLAVSACQADQGPSNSTLEVTSGRDPNASVNGTVTYRERLALSPEASLVVELRDVSYADAAAPLIAKQTISDPGQVPIKFKVEYNRDDIDSSNIYAISARIIEADGRLAFTNDTAYDVITRGNPSKVDMLLVLVQPPPDLVGEGDDWRTWVEVPAPVAWANLIPNENGFLRVAYYQSTIEGCARPGSEGLELHGNDIIVSVTLMQPPQTAWSIPCDEQVVELDAVLPIQVSLEPGQTYRVIVNDRVTSTFSLPRDGLSHSIVSQSPIESVEATSLDSAPPKYELRVVSGMPRGRGCSQFNGYEVRRGLSNKIEVAITHHEVADQFVVCTADFPIIETIVPLGSDFESGAEYSISVNSDKTASFVAR